MTASQNGWRANDRSVISTRNVPGTSVRLAVRNGAPGDLLLEVAARFHREVETIDGIADDWGYAERLIRGSSTDLSNHASGTAIDVNATRHPLAKAGTFSSAQVATIRRIVLATGGVVRWGGDYSGRVDEMHFEINDGKTVEDCARALEALRGAPAPATKTSTAPSSSSSLKRGDTDASTGGRVSALQEVLAAWYPSLGLRADGIFGPATEQAVRVLQDRARIAVDGIAGRDTLAVLHMA